MAGAMGGFLAGSIVAKMLLDKSGWNSSVSSIQGDVKNLKGQTGGLSGIVNSMATAWTLGGAAIVGTISSIVMKTADYGDMLDELRQKTGISTDVLSSFTLAVNKTDLGMGGFATSMKFLSNNLYDASVKGGEAEEKFKRLGVAFENADGSIRPLDQVMLDVADKFVGMKDGAEKSATAVDLFGRAGTGMIHMLNLGRDGLQVEMDKAKEFGLVMTNEAAAAGDKFSETLVDLKGSLQGITMQLGNALLPVLTEVAERVIDLISGFGKWLEQNPWVIESIRSTVEEVFKLAGNIGKLAGEIIKICGIVPNLIKELTGLEINLSYVSHAGLDFTNTILEAITDLDNWRAAIAMTPDDFARLDAAMRDTTNTGKAFSQSILDIIAPLTLTKEQLWGYEQTLRSLTGAKKVFCDIVVDTGGKIVDLGEKAKQFSIKLRDDVKKEIKETEEMLRILTTTAGVATPGAINELNKRLKSLNEYLTGTRTKLVEVTIAARDMGPFIFNSGVQFKELALDVNATLLPALDKTKTALMSLAMNFDLTPFVKTTETALTASEQAWLNFKQNVAQNIGDIVVDCLRIPKGIDDALGKLPPLFEGIFKIIYKSFQEFVSALIAKWVTDFLTDTFVNKTAEAAKTVSGTFSDMAGAVGKTITGAATSAIDTISGVVTAVTGILALFKKEDYSAITYWLKMIKDLNQEMHDVMVLNYLNMFESWNSLFLSANYCLYELHGRLVETRDAVSYWGGAICDAVKGIKGAQHGYVAMSNELVMVHGTPTIPEIILPEPIYERNLQMAAAMGGGQPGRPIEIYLNGEPVKFPMRENMRKIAIDLIPYMTKNEQLKIHPRSVRAF